jgi:spore maturation protein CgeB
MRFVFFGMSIASAWGSGHATTYRGLIRELHRRGHEIAFYEKRTEWYDHNCDLPLAPYCDIHRYEAWPPLGVQQAVAAADVVFLGSFTPGGVLIADWLPRATEAMLVYFDIDTPRTLQGFTEAGRTEYLLPAQLTHFDLVLSFAGGPSLDALRAWGARRVEAFYCAVDPELYQPSTPVERFQGILGYMGTYDASRQDMLDRLFITPSRLRPPTHFVLAGAQYPASILATLPPNVTHIVHVNPAEHSAFYGSCAWQVKVTRGAMREIGWSPSVTLFEATACGAPIISDRWPGLGSFFTPGEEVLVADSTADVLAALDLPEEERLRIAAAGRARVLREHTYVQRVDQLETQIA